MYISVTARVPEGTQSLIMARGPGFRLRGVTDRPRQTEKDEPTADEMARWVDEAYERDPRKTTLAGQSMGELDEGVVFAGAGEPLLRLEHVCEAARLIKESRHGVPLRVSTTGLIDKKHQKFTAEEAAQQLRDSGIDHVAQFFPSANPITYAKLMGGHDLGDACAFAVACVEAGITLRGVTVDGPKSDSSSVRGLLSSLGGVEFEAKPYVPAA